MPLPKLIPMSSFVRENRVEIDRVIRSEQNRGRKSPMNLPELDDEEREDWIANCSTLYVWAVASGVEV